MINTQMKGFNFVNLFYLKKKKNKTNLIYLRFGF